MGVFFFLESPPVAWFPMFFYFFEKGMVSSDGGWCRFFFFWDKGKGRTRTQRQNSTSYQLGHARPLSPAHPSTKHKARTRGLISFPSISSKKKKSFPSNTISHTSTRGMNGGELGNLKRCCGLAVFFYLIWDTLGNQIYSEGWVSQAAAPRDVAWRVVACVRGGPAKCMWPPRVSARRNEDNGQKPESLYWPFSCSVVSKQPVIPTAQNNRILYNEQFGCFEAS